MKKLTKFIWLKITEILLVKILTILPLRDRIKLVHATFLQIALGILDLFGVFLIGVVAAIAFRGIKSESTGDRTSKFLSVTGLDSYSMKEQLIILGVFAVISLCAKTILSIIFLRRALFFLSLKSAETTSKLISKILTQPKFLHGSRSIQQYIYAVTTGVANLTTGIYGSLIQIAADFGLLLCLTLGMFYVDFNTTLLTVIVFVFAGLVLFQFTQGRVKNLGKENAELVINSNNLLVEAFASIREIFVRNANFFYSTRIRSQREKLAAFDAELKFLPNISKFVSEILLVVGILSIVIVQFLKSDTNRAVAVVSIFMAASARIAPAVMRIQQNAITIKTYLASSSVAFALLQELRLVSIPERNSSEFSNIHENFDGSIVLNNLCFRYNDGVGFAIRNVSMCINPGKLTVIAGPSGSGKSTLLDLITGVLEPTSGEVSMGGLDPQTAIKKWPGGVGIVSQNAFVVNGTIRENVCIGLDATAIPDENVWEALKLANLEEFLSRNPESLSYQVGENGNKLSNGQKQRLMIARALITKPRILILDEATSSLDAESENEIIQSIEKLKEHVTIISVAHRLSITRAADMIFYLADGYLLESGTFEQLKKLNGNFATQARLMGL